MSRVLADTHAAVWYFHHDRRLSSAAVRAMNDTAAAGYPILIASISLVELTYLVEKGRIDREIRRRLISLLEMPEQPLQLIPLDARIAAAVESVAWKAVPDLPDRVTAATALALDVPLVTRDGRIRASGIRTIW